jgi:hypothetical protein
MKSTATEGVIRGAKAGIGYFKEQDFLNAILADIQAYARLRAHGYHSVTAFLAVWGKAYDDQMLSGRIKELEYSRQYGDAFKATFEAMDIRTMLAGVLV